MEKKTPELLFEYLRSIVFDNQIQHLDLDRLDPEYRDLGEGMQYLARCVEELDAYSADLSRGNLSADFPPKENKFCQNLKNLHANLNHLTWQAIQVADGDYSQRVSYLGEFSVAFNKMTEQLREREEKNQQEAENMQKRAELLQSYNDLFVNLTQHKKEWILIVNMENGAILYCNKNKDSVEGRPVDCSKCSNKSDVIHDIINHKPDRDGSWEIISEDKKKCYRINSYGIQWLGQPSYAHVVEDITAEKTEEWYLTDLAYHDPSTGTFNRRYLTEKMEQLLNNHIQFSFCFLDIDGLKPVNDDYGHKEGDIYIQSIADAVRAQIRSDDILARIGGDEFGVIFLNCPQESATAKMNSIYEKIRGETQKSRPYNMGFSYGILEVPSDSGMGVDEVIHKTDQFMYACKLKHRKNRTVR